MIAPAGLVLLAALLVAASGGHAAEETGGSATVASVWRAAGQPSLSLSWLNGGAEHWNPAARQAFRAAFRMAGIPLSDSEAGAEWRLDLSATPEGELSARLVAVGEERTGPVLTAATRAGGWESRRTVAAARALAEAVLTNLKREWNAENIACPDWRRRAIPSGRGD